MKLKTKKIDIYGKFIIVCIPDNFIDFKRDL